MVGKVVADHDLTGIVVYVTLSLSPRNPPSSVPKSNARVRTGDTIVALEMVGMCGVRRGVDTVGGE